VIYLQIACTYADASCPVDEKAKQILHEIISDIDRDEGLESSESDDESDQMAIIAIYPSCMMREPDP
jgi:hypothetical protein